MDYGIQANVWGRIRVQLRRYLSAIRRIWWLLPLTTSAGMCLAAWIVSQMPPAYQSTGEMIYSGQFQLTGSSTISDEMDNYFGTQIHLLLSTEVQQEAIERVKALRPDLDVNVAPTVAVVQAKEANILSLRATARTPEFAQTFVDAWMQAYLDERHKLFEDMSNSTSSGLSKQMEQLNKEMDENETEMLAFEKANNVAGITDESNSEAKYLDELERNLSQEQSEYDLESTLDLDQNLDRQNNASATGPATTAADAAGANRLTTALTNYGPIADYQKARQDVALLQSQLAEMSRRLKPKHPDIKALELRIQQEQDLITTLRAQSEEAFKTHLQSLDAQIENSKKDIAAQQQKALQFNGILAQYNAIKTRGDRAKQEYDQLLSNIQSVNVTKNVDQDPLSVWQKASLAISVKPGLLKILLAGIGGGLLVGLLILFVMDQNDDRISSLMELQTHFPEQLLGQIPEEKLSEDGALLRSDDDRQALLESFRTLRSSLIFLPVEGKKPKTIVITSALPDEGKTTVSSNLAVTLAFSGARTLIVDADLRRGQVSHVFGAINCNGFSNVLLQKKTWRECVYTTSIENLFIMPCGPALHHTSEHLLGTVTDQFLVNIYSQFDYVVFDSPPVIILDDTLCLAPKCDATLFVLRFNTSSVRPSRRALELLKHRQANVIGIVCNGVTASETEYNYNYNYRQYGNRYAEVKPAANLNGNH
jgi:capsular exopolysaccharide synthesis family protein